MQIDNLVPNLFRRLFRSRQASMSVEFALGAPAVILAVTGVIEFSLAMFTQTLMEGALREASRYGITGYVPAGVTREAQIAGIISSNTIGMVDMSTVSISYKVYPTFGDVGKPEPFNDANGNGSHDAGETYTDINGNGTWDADMGAAGAGGPGDVVLYTVEYDWTYLTPIMQPFSGPSGKIKMRASVAVRNEPYPAAP